MSTASFKLRKPSEFEIGLLQSLALKSVGVRAAPDWISHVLVEDLDDGGMGSLRLWPQGVPPDERRIFGRAAAETLITDVDGVEILVWLDLDKDSRPFELDVWKTDFSPRRIGGRSPPE